MADAPTQNGTSALDLADADLLVELEQSTPDAVKKSRAHTRITIRAKVAAQPADMSRRLSLKIQGVTGDVSAGGCQLLFPMPLNVGDIYWFTFDRTVLDIAPTFGRCMRCRIVKDDAYETGIAFFNPVELPKSLTTVDDQPLI